MAITGTVKFFNADKGYGFIAPVAAATMRSCTSPQWSAPACRR